MQLEISPTYKGLENISSSASEPVYMDLRQHNTSIIYLLSAICVIRLGCDIAMPRAESQTLQLPSQTIGMRRLLSALRMRRLRSLKGG